MHRRDFFQRLAAGALLPLAGAAQQAFADNYPSKPIRLVVTQGTGSGSDVIGRLLAVKLGERLNQNVYVENKVGGGGILGHQFVLDQPPDGYTLLLSTTAPLVVVPAMNRNAHFRLGDFSAIAAALRSPYMLVVNTQPDSPRTLAELTRKLATTPSSFSSSGTGTLTHLATEMYLQQAGVKATHVPYKGSGQSLADLAGGQVLFSIDSPIAAAPLLRGGRLRALAVTSPQRLPGYPEVPTMAESGYPGLTLSTMGGLFGPPGVPAPIVERINREMAVVLTSAEVNAQFATMQTEPLVMSAADFRAQMLKDAPLWEGVVTRLGLTVD